MAKDGQQNLEFLIPNYASSNKMNIYGESTWFAALID